MFNIMLLYKSTLALCLTLCLTILDTVTLV